MPYSADTIAEMMEAYGTVESRFLKLREELIMRKYRTKRGKSSLFTVTVAGSTLWR